MSETKTKNLCTVPAADLTDSQYFIAEDGGELKRIPKAQVVLKKLEKMLATDTENLAGGGEVTAQELLDALAEQVANKLLAKSQVVNNLLATVEGNPLDATQGKALKELIDTTNNNLSKRFSSDSLVYSSIDDIPKSGSCFGTISKSIKIGDVTIPAYSRFSFMNTGNSSDGALFAIDSNGYSYTAYRTSGVWNKCIATATKSDLLNFKTFQFSIKTNTVKDGESQMYHGNVKISDDKNCPPNTVCIIPYGARLETDASRAGIISYRATDTFCAVSHPTISNKNFIVTVLAIYKS